MRSLPDMRKTPRPTPQGLPLPSPWTGSNLRANEIQMRTGYVGSEIGDDAQLDY